MININNKLIEMSLCFSVMFHNTNVIYEVGFYFPDLHVRRGKQSFGLSKVRGQAFFFFKNHKIEDDVSS